MPKEKSDHSIRFERSSGVAAADEVAHDHCHVTLLLEVEVEAVVHLEREGRAEDGVRGNNTLCRGIRQG